MKKVSVVVVQSRRLEPDQSELDRRLLTRLRESADTRAFVDMLKRRLVKEELDLNGLMHPNELGRSDIAQWASEVRYHRGFIDGLGFAITLIQTEVKHE